MSATPQQGNARQQRAAPQSNWPCGAHVDPAYFQIAEGTGGHLFLLAPFEIANSAPLIIAEGDHPQTIFRLAGSIRPGVHDFTVPIDSSVEGVLFSISVQCLQTADVLDPSGVPVTGDGVTDYADFRAERMVVVRQPRAGNWTLRASGNGLAGVMVQARTGIGLSRVEFSQPSGGPARPAPIAGTENVVRIHVSGAAGDVQASIVNAAFRTLARLPLTAVDDAGTFESRFTPGSEAFRVVVSGSDAQGLPFQRVHAPLLTAR